MPNTLSGEPARPVSKQGTEERIEVRMTRAGLYPNVHKMFYLTHDEYGNEATPRVSTSERKTLLSLFGLPNSESKMALSTIEEAVADIRDGKMIIIVDDEDRENEGDLVCAAEKVTPEVINFMATHGRGLICLPLTEERCDFLQLIHFFCYVNEQFLFLDSQ